MVTIKTENGTQKVRTSFRLTAWTVQKKEGGRWGILSDENGPIIVGTRKLAREVSREFRNLRPRAKFRVGRIPLDGSKRKP